MSKLLAVPVLSLAFLSGGTYDHDRIAALEARVAELEQALELQQECFRCDRKAGLALVRDPLWHRAQIVACASNVLCEAADLSLQTVQGPAIPLTVQRTVPE